ncbi:MAG TPA: FmdB family transcriptional regulator [Bacteroidetes bacterium]|nr:FmdB family transcriptional regulator [Bacteroidota bacterium]HCN36635.1 FmdB family transcriptional regulator [Bacteroidota bacterium]
MPTYDYKCTNCGNQTEIFQSIKDNPITKCEVCGKDTLKRMIGGGAGLIFKGSGFYLTDYKNTGSGSEKKTASSATKKDTNTVKSENTSTAKSESKSETKSETKTETKTDKNK